jgi:hypothetical protein
MDATSTLLGIAVVVLLVLLLFGILKSKRLERLLTERTQEMTKAREELGAVRLECERTVVEVQKLVDQQRAALDLEAERVRQHFDGEARKAKAESDEALKTATKQIEALSRYQRLIDEEGDATRALAEALTVATSLKSQASGLLEAARDAAIQERSEASKRLKEIQAQADALLDQATREAGRMVEEAEKRAQDIGGDAYKALRQKEQLEQAVTAIRNVIGGYGDRYIIPTRSILDDLAAEFGHTQAGHALAAARDQTKRMVEEGHAASCDYAEQNRRDTAIRFVIDAFNGRVDAILSRSRHDNLGTLSQEIRDAFALVNQNGVAFRNARILPAYLDARLHELKWAVVVHELRLKEREEQRRIKEQMREEEKARREYERAIEEAQKEERAIQKALARVQEEAQRASAEQRAALEGRIAELNEQLAAAEAKNQRALSMAQQTRKGTIYIISNIGSFGEEVFKIGMTRRLEPTERIKELGDASVPFEFDVHAMIPTDDAPALEARLHREFEESRINKVNYRKEFFRISPDRLRQVVAETGLEISFTLLAEAREYRETQALGNMSPSERTRYLST